MLTMVGVTSIMFFGEWGGDLGGLPETGNE